MQAARHGSEGTSRKSLRVTRRSGVSVALSLKVLRRESAAQGVQVVRTMKQYDIQAPRRALEERRRDLLTRWRESQAREQELLDERRADWEDTSAEQRDAALLDAIGERELRRLDAIESALLRIDAGTYGTCEVCGEPIEEGRLRTLPEASRCLGCASVAEGLRAPLGVRE